MENRINDNFKIIDIDENTLWTMFAGDLDFIGASLCNQGIQAVLHRGKCKTMIFDLNNVNYISAVFIGAMINYAGKTQLVLTNLNNSIRKQFSRQGFNLENYGIMQ